MVAAWKMEGDPDHSRFAGLGIRSTDGKVILPNDTKAEIVRYSDFQPGSEDRHKETAGDFDQLAKRIEQGYKETPAPRFQQPVPQHVDVKWGSGTNVSHRLSNADYKLINEHKYADFPFSRYELESKSKDPKKDVVLPEQTKSPLIEQDKRNHGKGCHLITFSGRPRGKSRDGFELEHIYKEQLVSIPIRDVKPEHCHNGRCELRTKISGDRVCHGDKGAVVHCKNGGHGHKATHIVESRGHGCSSSFRTTHLAHLYGT